MLETPYPPELTYEGQKELLFGTFLSPDEVLDKNWRIEQAPLLAGTIVHV